MSSNNQLTLSAFSDEKLIPIEVEMTQSQVSNNNNMLFHFPLASIHVQPNNDEKQKATMTP